MDQARKLALLDSLPTQIERVDRNRLLIEYDRESDTLMILLDAERQPGMSVRIARDLFLRVAPDRETLLGLQLEHYVSRLVTLIPESLNLLDVATDPGLTDQEIMNLRRSVAQEHPIDRLDPLRELVHYAHGD